MFPLLAKLLGLLRVKLPLLVGGPCGGKLLLEAADALLKDRGVARLVALRDRLQLVFELGDSRTQRTDCAGIVLLAGVPLPGFGGAAGS